MTRERREETAVEQVARDGRKKKEQDDTGDDEVVYEEKEARHHLGSETELCSSVSAAKRDGELLQMHTAPRHMNTLGPYRKAVRAIDRIELTANVLAVAAFRDVLFLPWPRFLRWRESRYDKLTESRLAHHAVMSSFISAALR